MLLFGLVVFQYWVAEPQQTNFNGTFFHIKGYLPSSELLPITFVNDIQQGGGQFYIFSLLKFKPMGNLLEKLNIIATLSMNSEVETFRFFCFVNSKPDRSLNNFHNYVTANTSPNYRDYRCQQLTNKSYSYGNVIG